MMDCMGLTGLPFDTANLKKIGNIQHIFRIVCFKPTS